MPKRKAEGPPNIEPNIDVLNPESKPVENSANSSQEVLAASPVGGGQSGEAAGSHLDPLQSEVDNGSVHEDNPLWALLALDGYDW